MPISFLLLLFDGRRVVCWQVLSRVPLSHSKLLPWWLTKLARDNSWEEEGETAATERPTYGRTDVGGTAHTCGLFLRPLWSALTQHPQKPQMSLATRAKGRKGEGGGRENWRSPPRLLRVFDEGIFGSGTFPECIKIMK